VENIAKYIRKGQIVILKSTTFPGTTEKYVMPILEKSGLIAGVDFFLAFSPERIDPGNKKWNTSNTPIVVGGVNHASTELACEVSKLIINQVVPVSSPSIAELEKLLENIFRSVNIALVNELALLCDRIGIDVWEVIEAASTKPFGFMPFYPGPGIGGHCILIDPYYLEWMAREYDFETKFITLAAEINEDMPFYVKAMVIREIARQPITINNAKILLLGMAFKRDVSDLRHSPALKVAELLSSDGIKNLDYYDPYIPKINVNSNEIQSIKDLTPEILKTYDVIIITTDHSVFDFDMIAKNCKVVIDTRNACKNIKDKKNIVLLGEGK
jgi:UDP-N-acetyl-D-glucosamine dehydrogenase